MRPAGMIDSLMKNQNPKAHSGGCGAPSGGLRIYLAIRFPMAYAISDILNHGDPSS
jgi:hypothetical protein